MAEEGGRLEKRKSSCLSSDESDSERENGHSRSHSRGPSQTACGLETTLLPAGWRAPSPCQHPSPSRFHL